MPSYNTPKKNVAHKLFVSLTDQANTKLAKVAPTIASGDFKVSIDGGAFANLATLPSVNPAGGRAVMIDLSAAEMNGDNIIVQCVDAAGAEWCDLILNLQTTARQIDDLAFPLTSGRGILVDVTTGFVTSNVASNIKKNQALANFHFLMTDSTNHNPATGKTVSVTRVIDGGSASAGALSSVTEIGNGLYRVDFAASDLNGNVITLRATATACDDLQVTIVTEP
jgi:hypothetical protein